MVFLSTPDILQSQDHTKWHGCCTGMEHMLQDKDPVSIDNNQLRTAHKMFHCSLVDNDSAQH